MSSGDGPAAARQLSLSPPARSCATSIPSPLPVPPQVAPAATSLPPTAAAATTEHRGQTTGSRWCNVAEYVEGVHAPARDSVAVLCARVPTVAGKAIVDCVGAGGYRQVPDNAGTLRPQRDRGTPPPGEAPTPPKKEKTKEREEKLSLVPRAAVGGSRDVP